MRNNPAALPSGQASSLAIAIEGIANSHAVDSDRALDTADGLTGKGEHMAARVYSPVTFLARSDLK